VPAGTPDAWLEHATEHPGSWWKEWSAWLAPFRGPMKAAPRGPGSRRHEPIEPAPGSYVKQRAD